MAVNETYSFKDFMHQTCVDADAEEFNGTEIIGSCFYQEAAYDADSLSASPKDPRVDVFPAGMTGVTFRRCNLDNCTIPPGNTVVTGGNRPCSNLRIRVQNDLEDWELGTDNKPVEPLSKDMFIEKGLSIDPKDIPATKQDKPITDVS